MLTHMKPTCSSASKSALYWAMSSGGLFWTRVRHSSQMAKPAMNMPMSGMNTRIPFPASAPITLQTNRKQSTKTYRKQTTNAVIWRNSCRLLEQERDPLQYRTLLFSCLYPLANLIRTNPSTSP